VDAGVHLAAIKRILEPYLPEGSDAGLSLAKVTSGPFAGLELPFESASANAAHVTRTLIDTYLITHPHLDHISGFVVNTASLPGSRPKRLAGLPSTIAAFKTHIFNNVIWPNLTDENNGAGLVTYMRLVEGGSPALGAGEGKGYIEMCEGLSVKTWSVSHGHCMENHPHRGSSVGQHSHHSHEGRELSPFNMRRSHSNTLSSAGVEHLSPAPYFDSYPTERICVYDSSAYFIRDITTGSEVLIFGDVEPDSISLSPRNVQVWSEAAPKIASGKLRGIFIECSYDDSQTDDTLFGHLAPRYLIGELLALAEQVYAVRFPPDSANSLDSGKKRKRQESHRSRSLSPGTSGRGSESDGDMESKSYVDFHGVKSKSISKNTRLYEDSGEISPLSRRFSHGPFHDGQNEAEGSFRNFLPNRSISFLRESSNGTDSGSRPTSVPNVAMSTEFGSKVTRGTSGDVDHGSSAGLSGMLEGLKIIIIHVKDKLNDDPPVGDLILEQLKQYDAREKLGCEFLIAWSGMSVML
jgi:cAMP phosphodiesterase